MDKCSFCGSTYKEISQTGFVGCENCYVNLSELKTAITAMFEGKVHQGRRVNGNIR